ncbi:MAG TPA: enoyl-[acyl-carrier-protein] reductase FabK [Peptococcaceae bacterium]|nr:MAG: 2-nitropropane dioxygenase, NPD [Clostridia bacterium 41_269]HBT20029.1 enoyl-[acyl-carrier-protein] reductase FabK [Peptococcaceae bacterium]
MIGTELCSLLGIKYPIFQGGMAWIATGELAAAVSNAGGLGIIGAGNAPPEVVREEIKKVKDSTDNPFGVNVYYMSPHVDEIISLVIEEKVPVITTGGGNPGKHVSALKNAGIKVFPVVASVALAKRLEKLGVDGLIAEGMECGGHIGDVATMPLVPQIVRTVNLPVIAAGGIATGEGLAAALALGAVGVQMGTRFICASECTVHRNYKEAVIKAKDRDTVVTGFSGHYVRVLKNKLAREFKELEARGASKEEFEELGAGRLKKAVLDGDIENGSVMAGQIAALVNEIKPAKEIIEEIIAEAKEVILRISRYIEN